MSNLSLLRDLSEKQGSFSEDTLYSDRVVLAAKLFDREQYDLCEDVLNSLPTLRDLLAELITQLKGKPVYKTLIKIQQGEGNTVGSKYTMLKGLSSLMTHVAISCEHGDTRYKMLIPYITEKISELGYRI